MSTVSDFLEKLRGINVVSLTKDIVDEEQEKIVDLNRLDQIFIKGVDSQNRPLDVYAKRTQEIYDNDPSVTDNSGMMKGWKETFNLFWTGKSYHSFRAYVRGTQLFITANTRARKLLIENAGEEVFGLTPDNAEVVNNEIIAPKLNEKIKELLL